MLCFKKVTETSSQNLAVFNNVWRLNNRLFCYKKINKGETKMKKILIVMLVMISVLTMPVNAIKKPVKAVKKAQPQVHYSIHKDKLIGKFILYTTAPKTNTNIGKYNKILYDYMAKNGYGARYTASVLFSSEIDYNNLKKMLNGEDFTYKNTKAPLIDQLTIDVLKERLQEYIETGESVIKYLNV